VHKILLSGIQLLANSVLVQRKWQKKEAQVQFNSTVLLQSCKFCATTTTTEAKLDQWNDEKITPYVGD